MKILDSILAVAAADKAVADAAAGVVTAQAQLQAAQAQVTTARAADVAADQQLAADLKAGGPVFVVNQDGTATFYAAADGAPGFTVTTAQPAGSVDGATPPAS